MIFPTLILTIIKSVLGRVLPDAGQVGSIIAELGKEFLDHEDEITKAAVELAKGQTDIDLVEAQSPRFFMCGWRPACAWICVAGCGYCFLIQPLASWLFGLFGAAPLPALDGNSLMALLSGLLGLGTLRTVDKIRGVETR